MAVAKTSVAASGYSGTPLVKKLGIKPGFAVIAANAPEEYRSWLSPLPDDVRFLEQPSAQIDLVHVFCTGKSDLAQRLSLYRKTLRSDAIVWVSWPKKTSRRATDITEDTIREVALPMGWVDIKVCAVDDVWSGLKLMLRRELR